MVWESADIMVSAWAAIALIVRPSAAVISNIFLEFVKERSCRPLPENETPSTERHSRVAASHPGAVREEYLWSNTGACRSQ